MATIRLQTSWRWIASTAALLLAWSALDTRYQAARADAPRTEMRLPAALLKPVPESVEDLKAIQAHVKVVIAKVMPAVVAVRIGNSAGSGVIVSEDGFILTAGHVSGKPGQEAIIIFPDGKELKGKTLGQNKSIDSGMIKLEGAGKYPFCDIGKSGDLKKGEWCIGIGHPGGFKPGRTPPVRLGRVLDCGPVLIRTDCTLVGGDSGGPLFDMYGRVIGIHSRINGPITHNIHVPVDTYKETWNDLAQGKTLPLPVGLIKSPPWLGVHVPYEAKDCKLAKVTPDSPAAKAGLRADDIITGIDGKKIFRFEDLQAEIERRRPNDVVNLEVVRAGKTLKVEVKLGQS
jgi:serine protease Do